MGSDKTSRFTIGLRHAPCETQAGHQRTELGDQHVDTLAEFARLESTDSALGVTRQDNLITLRSRWWTWLQT